MAKNYREVAQSWIDGNFDAQTKEEVRKMMEGDQTLLEDAFYRNLEFGTGGLRGIMGVGTNRMNKYVVGMATQGLANYIRKNVRRDNLSVSISFDSRNHSAEFAGISAEILAANGIDVFIFESLRPTPELSYAIRANGSIAGIMVTASHNPAEYNGYKVFWEDGGQITSPVDKDIVAEVNRIEDPSQICYVAPDGCKAGRIVKMGEEMDNRYIADILSLTLSPEAREACASKIKIVYTPLHGTGVRIVPECLRRLGFTNVFHVPAQDVNDGNFPTVASPNPEEQSALKMALEVAERQGADLVLATDPDADRMGIAVRDDEGSMVLLNGNQTASIMTYYILTRWKELGKLGKGGYIVKTIVTSELLREIGDSFGVKCYDVLTGFKYIAEVVKTLEGRGQFICGGEESYGFNVGEFVRDKDAPVACSIIADCAAWAASRGKTLYQVLQEIYARCGYRKEALVSIVRKGKSGSEEIAAMMADFRNNPPAQLAGRPVVKVIDYLTDVPNGLGPDCEHISDVSGSSDSKTPAAGKCGCPTDAASAGFAGLNGGLQPKSNVLQFFSSEGDVVSVRPSGTEPKIKFYFGAKGPDADAIIEKLKAQFA